MARSRQRQLHPLADAAIYRGIRGVVAALGLLPTSANMRLMRALGGAFAKSPMNRARRQRAIDNLRQCFPEWSDDLVERVSVDAYRHLLSLGAEILATPAKIRPHNWRGFIDLGDTERTLTMLNEGRACVLITGHCGNWELLGYGLGELGYRVSALYRPLDLAPLDRWVKETRQVSGLRLIDKFGAMRDAPAALKSGESVSFIADQNGGDRGLFVPYFGRLASTYKAPGLLATQFDAPIICGHAYRPYDEAGGVAASLGPPALRYRVDITDVIMPEDWKDQPDPLFYIAARYRRAIEKMVQKAPAQYLWMHRYWKSRPPWERQGRPMPVRMREKIASLPWMTEDAVARVVDRSARDAATVASKSTPRAPEQPAATV